MTLPISFSQTCQTRYWPKLLVTTGFVITTALVTIGGLALLSAHGFQLGSSLAMVGTKNGLTLLFSGVGVGLVLSFYAFSYTNEAASQPNEEVASRTILPANAQSEIHEVPDVKIETANRWRAFQNNTKFVPFEAGKSDSILRLEFENIQSTRESMWETLEYTRAEHLITNDLVRAPGCAAFAYNNTASDYNASTICLRDQYYIACEGPRSKDLSRFFKLLKNSQITHLVRLTDAREGEIKKCHPYWEGLLRESGHLNIPIEKADTYSIRAFDMAYWRDNEGVDPNQLLTLVLRVKRELAESEGRLLIHCSAGVGRTGTFLAALEIIETIDREESLSIEEIVYRLSLQRAHSVGKLGQYITLNRLAENYLQQKT